jgi:hypothetical protein
VIIGDAEGTEAIISGQYSTADRGFSQVYHNLGCNLSVSNMQNTSGIAFANNDFSAQMNACRSEETRIIAEMKQLPAARRGLTADFVSLPQTKTICVPSVPAKSTGVGGMDFFTRDAAAISWGKLGRN